MRGVLRYRRDDVVAILDSERAAGDTERRRSGRPERDEALRFEPTAALVGVATQGGRFPPAWIELLKQCVAAGLDVENGLHVFLTDDPELEELARAARRRAPRPAPPAGRPLDRDRREPRRAGNIVLTVGSDCAIGKMTVSLELDLEARRRGLASVFVPTGQTGIAIAGWGISVDAVVADFIAGAAERLVVEGSARAAGRPGALGRGPGLARPSGVLGCHARALPRLRRRTPSSSATRRATPRSRARAAGRIRSRRSPSSSSCTSVRRSRARPARVAALALNTRDLAEDERASGDRRRLGRDGPAGGRSRPLRRGDGSSTPSSRADGAVHPSNGGRNPPLTV